MRVLVTGGNGLLGSHVIDAALDRGYRIRALLLPEEPAKRWLGTGTEVCRGDLTDSESLNQAINGIDVVLHCASRKGPWGPQRDYARVNVLGTRNILAAAQKAGVSRFVHVSSTAVLGADIRGRGDETSPLRREPNPYNWSKMQAELLLQQEISRGAPVTIIRTGLLYGPRDTKSFGRFCRLIQKRRMPLIGSGDNHLPLVYVRDVAVAMLLASEIAQAVGQTYNIVGDEPVTQKQYLSTIARELGVAAPRLKIPYRAARMMAAASEMFAHAVRLRHAPPLTRFGVGLLGGENRFRIDKARKELGFAPRTSLSDGVRTSVEWFLNDCGALSAGERLSRDREAQHA